MRSVSKHRMMYIASPEAQHLASRGDEEVEDDPKMVSTVSQVGTMWPFIALTAVVARHTGKAWRRSISERSPAGTDEAFLDCGHASSRPRCDHYTTLRSILHHDCTQAARPPRLSILSEHTNPKTITSSCPGTNLSRADPSRPLRNENHHDRLPCVHHNPTHPNRTDSHLSPKRTCNPRPPSPRASYGAR